MALLYRLVLLLLVFTIIILHSAARIVIYIRVILFTLILFFAELQHKFRSIILLWPGYLFKLTIILISVFIILILLSFEIITSTENIKSFSGNVASEFIGIALTVFIINRLIKQREEERLLVQKQIINARLLLVIDRPLEAMARLFPGEYCKLEYNGYRYNYTPIASPVVFDDLSTLRASILRYVEQYIEKIATISESANNRTVQHSNIYNDAHLPVAVEQINYILSTSNSLIELELMELLLQFVLDCANLKRVADTYENCTISNNRTSKLLAQVVLLETIEIAMKRAINVRAWLISRADSHYPPEQSTKTSPMGTPPSERFR